MAIPFKRPMYPAIGDKPPTIGKDVSILKFGLHRYGTLGPAGDNFFTIPENQPPTQIYTPRTRQAVKVLQQLERGAGNTDIKTASGAVGRATWEVVWQYLDEYRRMQYRAFIPPKPKPAVPDLGPIYSGGKSVLLHQLTHNTDGWPNPSYPWPLPAFDDGWVAGRTVIAPEDLIIISQSGSAGGDAVFARGASKLEYWIGHMAFAPPTGRVYHKGEKVGSIGAIPWSQGGPHVHLGINAIPLIGKSLLYGANGNGPDYTYGAPSVGAQLKEALS